MSAWWSRPSRSSTAWSREMTLLAPDLAPGAGHAHLPGGLWTDAAEPLRTLTVRPVGEQDLSFLLDTATELPPAERANQLLARCLEPELRHLVPRLTVGDREALLLQLRSLTLGDMLESLVSCPQPECGAVMQVDLDVRDVLLPEYDGPQPEHELTWQHRDTEVLVRLRLPCASDLDDVSALAAADPDMAATTLLGACVRELRLDGSPTPLTALDDVVVAELERHLAELDPQAEIELELVCSECALPFVVPFDAGAFLLQEVDERAAQLLLDVHTLALHYHWQERDILDLDPARRARYLDLIASSTTAAPSLWEAP